MGNSLHPNGTPFVDMNAGQPTPCEKTKEIDEDPLITQECMRILQDERGVDSRCLDYWKQHPEYHPDIIHELEDPAMPPGRDANRDESPFWMTRLKKWMEKCRAAGKVR